MVLQAHQEVLVLVLVLGVSRWVRRWFLSP
jgi:hypothetical protein